MRMCQLEVLGDPIKLPEHDPDVLVSVRVELQ
jgi:hypothetical protein